MKLFKFKKISAKISFIVTAMVVIFGGAACAYMQTRIIDEIDNHSRLYVRYNLKEVAEYCDLAIAYDQDVSDIEAIVRGFTLYETGFALLTDVQGEFFRTNDFIQRLSAADRNTLRNLAASGQTDTVDMRLNNIDFSVAHIKLINDFSLFALAPRSEVMADANASLIRFPTGHQ